MKYAVIIDSNNNITATAVLPDDFNIPDNYHIFRENDRNDYILLPILKEDKSFNYKLKDNSIVEVDTNKILTDKDIDDLSNTIKQRNANNWEIERLCISSLIDVIEYLGSFDTAPVKLKEAVNKIKEIKLQL